MAARCRKRGENREAEDDGKERSNRSQVVSVHYFRVSAECTPIVGYPQRTASRDQRETPGFPGRFSLIDGDADQRRPAGFALGETFTVAVWLSALPQGLETRTQYDVVSLSADVVKFADVPPASGKFTSPLAPVYH